MKKKPVLYLIIRINFDVICVCVWHKHFWPEWGWISLWLFSMCSFYLRFVTILMESFLKEKATQCLSDEWKSYDVSKAMTMEWVRIKKVNERTNGIAYKAKRRKERARIAILNRTRRRDTYARLMLMSWHIVAVTYNFTNTRLLMAMSAATISKCRVCVCIVVLCIECENFIVFHKLYRNHLLL